jgi:hypothetical protein
MFLINHALKNLNNQTSRIEVNIYCHLEKVNTLICFHHHLILLFHGVLFAMKLKMFIFAHLIHISLL